MLDLSYMQSRHMNELSQAKFETLKTLLNFNESFKSANNVC